jgi:hypothetical protein
VGDPGVVVAHAGGHDTEILLAERDAQRQIEAPECGAGLVEIGARAVETLAALPDSGALEQHPGHIDWPPERSEAYTGALDLGERRVEIAAAGQRHTGHLVEAPLIGGKAIALDQACAGLGQAPRIARPPQHIQVRDLLVARAGHLAPLPAALKRIN